MRRSFRRSSVASLALVSQDYNAEWAEISLTKEASCGRFIIRLPSKGLVLLVSPSCKLSAVSLVFHQLRGCPLLELSFGDSFLQQFSFTGPEDGGLARDCMWPKNVSSERQYILTGTRTDSHMARHNWNGRVDGACYISPVY